MPKLDFAMIDAKDFAVVHIKHAEWGMAKNLHNAEVLSEARVEYMRGLADLQKRVRDKYEPQLIENVSIKGEDPKDTSFEEQERLQDIIIVDLVYH